MYELNIDRELKELIPPLSTDEYSRLEKSILEEGCKEPIVVWNNTIIDGHNRYKICKENNITFKTVDRNFATRDDAKLWMIGNQLARRNLNNYARTTLVSLSDEIQAALRKTKETRESNLKQNTEKQKAEIYTDDFEEDFGMHRFSNFGKSEETPKTTDDKQNVNTTLEIAKQAKVGKSTVSKALQINKAIDEAVKQNTTVAGQKPEDLKEKLMSGEVSIDKAYNKIRLAKKHEEITNAERAKHEQASDEYKPYLTVGDGIGFVPDEKYDVLMTDPPYSTDVDNIEEFVDGWLYNALDNVKDTGFAYVFIGAYPEEQKAYLNARIPDHIKLEQMLVWSYKNTLGQAPKDKYNLNHQICLFYKGINAPNPNFDNVLTEERWTVQEVNAPDGRQGDRYHMWQKPMEIAERFVRHSTKPGMTVFDPFACTGTFLLAATKLGRKAYGFEIDPDNAAIAFERGCVRSE